MASGLTGVKLTTSEVRSITNDIKNISADIDDTMNSFKNIMADLTGQSEGGLIDQTVTAAEQLFEGVTRLAKCFLDIGIKIGDYLKMVLDQDAERASELRNRIEG